MPWATSRTRQFFVNVGRTARDTFDRNGDGRLSGGEIGLGALSLATGWDAVGYGQRSIDAARNNFGDGGMRAPTSFTQPTTSQYNYRGNEVESVPREYVRPPDVPIQPAGDYTPRNTETSSGGSSSGSGNRPRAGGAYVSWAVGPNANSAARRSNLITGGYDQGGALGMSNRSLLRQSSGDVRRSLVQPR